MSADSVNNYEYIDHLRELMFDPYPPNLPMLVPPNDTTYVTKEVHYCKSIKKRRIRNKIIRINRKRNRKQ